MSLVCTPPTSSRRRRRSLFNNSFEKGEKDAATTNSPAIVIPSSRYCSASPSSAKKRSMEQLPAKFRQELPRRSQIASPFKEEPLATFSPISQSAFYGHSTSKQWPKKPLNVSSASSGGGLDNSFDKKVASRKAPPAKKPRNNNNYGARNKKNKYGINKGVVHAIKKPKPQKVSKKAQKSPITEKEGLKAPPTTPKTPASYKQAQSKSGQISMTKHTNVSYEIKNGQPVFRLRRSPRKCPYMESSPAPVSRTPKTPKQLFTPSSQKDYLATWQASPPKSSRRNNLPSPVKFHVEDAVEKEADKENVSNSVMDIINNLNSEENVSQDNYAMYVTDNELAKVAQETVQQLEEINAQDAELQMDDTAAEIREILANMPPPTEAELKESRCTLQLRLEDSSNDGFPSSPLRSKENTPQKLFPVFQQKAKSSINGIENEIWPKRRDSNSTKNVPFLNNKEGGKTQMIIDAGQKKIGPEICLICDFVYNPNDAEDVKHHQVKHALSLGVIKFPGWKNERQVGDFPDGHVVLVRPGDPKRHWEKVDSVLEVVDRTLGITAGGGVRNPQQSKAFMFVADSRVVGFLLAETLSKSDKLSRAEPKITKDNTTLWVLTDIMTSPENILAGISRIWVSPDYQRSKIATRLVDAMTANFIPGRILKKGEFAFTHTTPSGAEFASKYTKSQGRFLTYAPTLDGVAV